VPLELEVMMIVADLDTDKWNVLLKANCHGSATCLDLEGFPSVPFITRRTRTRTKTRRKANSFLQFT